MGSPIEERPTTDLGDEVNELDEQVIRLNEQAADRMVAERRLVIVPSATHLFEEPGAMDTVADLAGDWFTRHLATSTAAHR